jgi:hypothetical protein
MASGRLRLHGQAAERCQDPHAVALAVAMRVLPELGVAGPVPGVLDGPAVAHVLQQRLGSSAQTRDVVTGLIDRFAVAGAFAANFQDRGAARPVLHYPRWGRHAPQHPGEDPAAFAFTLAGLPRRVAAIGQPVLDHLRSLVTTVFYSDQEVGITLFEVEEKGRFACSASACTSKPLSSTRSRSWRKAAISPPASVA